MRAADYDVRESDPFETKPPVMLAAGGYPWTVIPVEERDAYMAALEVASATEDIGPFIDFLATLVRDNLEGKPGPKVP